MNARYVKLPGWLTASRFCRICRNYTHVTILRSRTDISQGVEVRVVPATCSWSAGDVTEKTRWTSASSRLRSSEANMEAEVDGEFIGIQEPFQAEVPITTLKNRFP